MQQNWYRTDISKAKQLNQSIFEWILVMYGLTQNRLLSLIHSLYETLRLQPQHQGIHIKQGRRGHFDVGVRHCKESCPRRLNSYQRQNPKSRLRKDQSGAK